MSLSRGDRECIDAYMSILMREVHNLTPQQRQHVVDITRGTEAKRKAAAQHYARETRLPAIDKELEAIDRRRQQLVDERAALVDYIK